MPPSETVAKHSQSIGRILALAAGALWSLNGVFNTALCQETALNLHVPEVHPLHIAFYRALFAGLAFLPGLKRSEVTWKRSMLFMVIAFAIMNVTFVTAMAIDNVAKALALQYVAPMWTLIAGAIWLGEKIERRSIVAVAIAAIGVATIVWGGWQHGQLPVVALGIVSGLSYSAVLVWLRLLKGHSSRWLTAINFLTSAAALLPFVFLVSVPSLAQFACLMLFGTIQLALPYWLITRSLKSISPQEVACLTLVEVPLSPIWAWLIASKPKPILTTDLIGAAIILGALLIRYVPWKRTEAPAAVSGDCQHGK
jgi:drug/metabolite transporter (DMT)-like permease